MKKEFAIDISFIIPYYKGGVFFEQLIQSITAAYGICSFYKIEIVIIIDSMETEEDLLNVQISNIIDKEISFVVFKNNANIGVAASRNKGIGLATGVYAVIIDQDDLISQQYFQCLKNLHLFNYDFILSNGMYLFEKNKKTINIFYLQPTISFENIVLKDIIRSPGQVILKTQFYSELLFPVPVTFSGADDKFFWVKLFAKYPNLNTMYSCSKLYIARLHSKNVSNNFKQLYFSALELWSMILSIPQFSLLKDSKIVQKSILFYKYKTKTYDSLYTKILGFIEVVKYTLNPNKVFVFLLKKVIT